MFFSFSLSINSLNLKPNVSVMHLLIVDIFIKRKIIFILVSMAKCITGVLVFYSLKNNTATSNFI